VSPAASKKYELPRRFFEPLFEEGGACEDAEDIDDDDDDEEEDEVEVEEVETGPLLKPPIGWYPCSCTTETLSPSNASSSDKRNCT
jgi:hypothetical protein